MRHCRSFLSRLQQPRLLFLVKAYLLISSFPVHPFSGTPCTKPQLLPVNEFNHFCQTSSGRKHKHTTMLNQIYIFSIQRQFINTRPFYSAKLFLNVESLLITRTLCSLQQMGLEKTYNGVLLEQIVLRSENHRSAPSKIQAYQREYLIDTGITRKQIYYREILYYTRVQFFH